MQEKIKRTLVLASGSPRRRQMLQDLGVDFIQRVVDVDETPLQGESAQELVRRLAILKSTAADPQTSEVVLAADTVVVIDGAILGKPRSPADAVEMLQSLCGRSHTVLSGVAVWTQELEQPNVRVESTLVDLDPLADDTIRRYVATGEPMDKAGSYAIQGLGSVFVGAIRGSYSNVVGLPLSVTRALLFDQGIEIPRLPAAVVEVDGG